MEDDFIVKLSRDIEGKQIAYVETGDDYLVFVFTDRSSLIIEHTRFDYLEYIQEETIDISGRQCNAGLG